MGFADTDADDGWGVSSLFVVAVVVVVRQVSYIFSLIFSLHFPYLRHRVCQAYKGGAKVKPVDYATLLCQPSHTHTHRHTHSLIRIFTFSSFAGSGDATGIFYASAILSRANTLPPFSPPSCARYVAPGQARAGQALRRTPYVIASLRGTLITNNTLTHTHT